MSQMLANMLCATARAECRQLLPKQSRKLHQSATSTKRPKLQRPGSNIPRIVQPQTRHASRFRGYKNSNLAHLMRHYPIMTPIALASVLFGACGFAYGAYTYAKLYHDMASFPERVGLKLRRAIYFTDISPDTPQAMKAFVGALQLAEAEGMDPLSDEVIGIKAEMARLLEKVGNAATAIQVLENVRAGCLAWIDKHDASQEEGAGKRRTALLKWACKLSVRIADLYSDPAVADPEKSEEYLVWSVETTLKEFQRRAAMAAVNGPVDVATDGEWLTPDEHGSQLEALGHVYEGKDKHYFASQLFLQAIMLKPTNDCHSIVLMNNLAASLAQHVPPAEPGMPPPSRADLRESGRAWVKRALELDKTIQGEDRTEECDRGCVVAMHNLGEFAEMDGNLSEAREKYEEAGSIAHAIGFQEGVISANEGLKRTGGSKNMSNTRFKSKGWW